MWGRQTSAIVVTIIYLNKYSTENFNLSYGVFLKSRYKKSVYPVILAVWNGKDIDGIAFICTCQLTKW